MWVIQGGDRLSLLQIGLFSWMKKHMYLPKENHLCLKLQIQACCFPVRTVLVFERKTSWKSELSKCADSFCSKQAYCAKVKKHVNLLKENPLC
jgi:hypothetical protein